MIASGEEEPTDHNSLDTGITFGPDNRFHMDTPIASSPFSTDLTESGSTVSGELVFAVQTYTVTFLDWDGTVLGSDSVVFGGSATPPSDPVRSGYRFIGWNTGLTDITADTTATALYEAEATPTPLPTPSDTESSLVATGDAQLPQTGDTQLSLIALALTALIGAGILSAKAAFTATRRRKDEPLIQK